MPRTREIRLANPVRRVLLASLVGSAIEFFDFYTYANAAVLVFPRLFFPSSDPTAAMMQSLVTFAIAFYARPIGSAFFGHFGDRIGRKATLVAALLTMGVSTVIVGMLPTYADIGALAPVLLALCRFGQGFGLGGEWGGAVLLATENAPPGRRSWYGMFPQLGAPIGFILSGATFLILSQTLSEAQFVEFGWRIPFLGSAVLVLVGLYVRLRIAETPAFEAAVKANRRVRVPILAVLSRHGVTLILGTLMATVTFQLFYLVTVFTQGWATGELKIPRSQTLQIQLFATLFFAAMIPVSAQLADRYGGRRTMIVVTLAILAFGLLFAPLFGSGAPLQIGVFLILGMALMGATYGPLGAVLAELFPTEIRYTGLSLTFNLAGILGASLAPYFAMGLARSYGLAYVGYYLAAGAALTLLALLLAGRRSQHPAADAEPAPQAVAAGRSTPAG
jgi:metabolite-proton symporter